MPWTSLRIAPGIVKNGTRYGASGTWFDCSLVRFRDGFPERWSGWARVFPDLTMQGACRSLNRHGTLDGRRWISAGTSQKFYMVETDLQYDVSPLDGVAPTPLLVNPLATTAGSPVVNVTHAAHAHFPGAFVVIAGATNVDGFLAADLNREHQVTGWVNENVYQITMPSNANSTVAAGGGLAVTDRFVFSAGSEDAVPTSGGWGGGAWSHEYGWGSSAGGATADQLGIWTHDNWGQDLVANANSGPIFYWRATFPEERMIEIGNIPADYLGPGSLPAGPHAPDEAQFIIVSHRDRHLLAFGASLYMGSGAVEPLNVRWCNQETITDWDDANTAGTAGSLPLSNGSRFLAGIATAREILVWTDQTLYSLQYVGAPFIYTADVLEQWSDICGLKACCSFNGVVYWMGNGGFYAYSGRTEKMPCPVWDYITSRINRDQMSKTYASSNQKYNEVLFFYQSNESLTGEIDSYVAYDVVQQLWTIGSLPRTAWLDIDASSPAIGIELIPADPISTTKFLEHDFGSDDGSNNPVVPLNAFIESGPIELSSEGSYDKGDRMMFVRKIMPDVTFRNVETSVTAPSMNIVLRMQDEPGSSWMDESSSPVQRAAVIPIEQFTRKAGVRLRGRSLTLRAESKSLGTEWRLGITRIDARTDGQR